MDELTKEQQDAIQAITEAFNEIYEAVKKIVEEIFKIVKEYIPIMQMLHTKHMMIYNRTKSKRIRKKQISLMRKKGFVWVD